MSFRIDITCSHCGETASFVVGKPIEPIQDLDTIGVDELDLGVREWNVLATANIRTVGDLVRCDLKQLLHYQNFGRKSLTKLEHALNEFFRRRGRGDAASTGESL